MDTFSGKTAVITGAASGIGFAMAERFASEGMRVVLADIEEAALDSAVERIVATGAEAIGVVTDVAKADDVAALADRARTEFGGIHVACNNAGVFAGGLLWEESLADYQWLMDVNVWGVIHGIRTFVPILLEQGEPAHVINTASMAALTSMPYTGIYFMTKHAVMSLSETLYHELTLRGAKVGVSVLCPEVIATNIDKSERSRPEALRSSEERSEERKVVEQALSKGVESGVPPEWIAERAVDAIGEGRFYVLSDEEWRRTAETRLEDIRLARNPTFAPPVSG